MSVRLAGLAAVVLLASLVGGCASYDYLQRTDRVSYHGGDAVKANLERETADPSNGAMYDTTGLGKNGSVVPADSKDGSAGGDQGQGAPKSGGAQPPAVQ